MFAVSCEDQGYSLISDGCNKCGTWVNGKKVYPALVREQRKGGEFWVCPVCKASYGPTL
jgi:hypothetical protein